MAESAAGSPADYLAAERTFLAWLRTGLALMGFGFVVARFGLFLQALELGHVALRPRPYGPSFWLGTALIVLGVAVNIVSAWGHVRLVRNLRQGTPSFGTPSPLALTVAALLAALGLAMAIYLVSVREPQTTHLNSGEEKPMSSKADNGIVSLPSQHSVDQTVQKLEELLQASGVKLFALIDHSGEAEKAGMQMRATKLLILGSPRAGTPLMVASPSIAIDLPLKILVAEDAEGSVWISYNSPEYLQSRHGLPTDLIQNIGVVAALAAASAR